MVRSALIRMWPLALLLAVGCDYVSDPVAPGTSGGPPPDGTVRRRILLEDFTGHRCNNCPSAHLVAAQLEAAFGDDDVMHTSKLSMQVESLLKSNYMFSICQTLNFKYDFNDFYGLRPEDECLEDPFEAYLKE